MSAAAEGGRSAEHGLRADAQRNRRRIVAAAREVLQERGPDAPLEEIAERAGVGIATLYRRFPSREELVGAVFEDRLREHAEAAEEALAHPDPWAGFSGYVTHVCATQAADRGLSELPAMQLAASPRTAELRDRRRRAVAALVRRAQEAGVLRDDFVPEDLFLFVLANAGVVRATRGAAPHAWRRLVAYLLEACRPGHAGPLPAAPTPLQVERSMREYATAAGLCRSGRGTHPGEA